MIASCSGALMGTQSMQSSPAPIIQTQIAKHAFAPKTESRIIFEQSMRGSAYIECISASWNKLNQRQIRKNRRRAHAAGKRHAFA